MSWWAGVFGLLLVASCGAQHANPRPSPASAPVTSSTATTEPEPAATVAGEPLCDVPSAKRDLERLAECVREAVSLLDAEPAEDGLSEFVKRSFEGGGGPQTAYADKCNWLLRRDLGGVRFTKKTGSWDHFEDGSASAHIELRFACSGPEVQATTTIELRMGEPERR
jgi:hypothetical protein